MGGKQHCSGEVETCGTCKYGFVVLEYNTQADIEQVSAHSEAGNSPKCVFMCSRSIPCAVAAFSTVSLLLFTVAMCMCCGDLSNLYSEQDYITKEDGSVTGSHQQQRLDDSRLYQHILATTGVPSAGRIMSDTTNAGRRGSVAQSGEDKSNKKAARRAAKQTAAAKVEAVED